MFPLLPFKEKTENKIIEKSCIPCALIPAAVSVAYLKRI